MSDLAARLLLLAESLEAHARQARTRSDHVTDTAHALEARALALEASRESLHTIQKPPTPLHTGIQPSQPSPAA